MQSQVQMPFESYCMQGQSVSVGAGVEEAGEDEKEVPLPKEKEGFAASVTPSFSTQTPATHFGLVREVHPNKVCPAMSQSGSGAPHPQSHPSRAL